MAPQFEVFTYKNARRLDDGPALTIGQRGTITLNRSAYEALGKPAEVDLLFDPEARIVGIRPSKGEFGYKVRRTRSTGQPASIGGRAYTQHYEIPTQPARRYPAQVDDGVLCAALSDGVEVTSNRSGTGRRT